jgi:hypothetical protein
MNGRAVEKFFLKESSKKKKKDVHVKLTYSSTAKFLLINIYFVV